MKIGIITIIDNNNYGNRLQNYAVQEVLKKLKINNVVTIKNNNVTNHKSNNRLKYYIKKIIFKVSTLKNQKSKISDRRKYFDEFNNNITFSKYMVYAYDKKIKQKFDYFIAGSDQIWNPNGRLSCIDLLEFAEPKQKISFAASCGVKKIPDKLKEYMKNNLETFKAISVREVDGKRIVEDLTKRDDIQVLIDPTMLLTANKWDMVAKKPKQLKNNKYILNYFLGGISEERKKEIDRIAKENNCEEINILDEQSPFYQTGPSEFLYLEKNAFLICTDSFHSCVFAILYNKPFIVFERQGKGESMNSRIETLIHTFNLKNRIFKGKIEEENLEHDYTEAFQILDKERKKSINFLKKALDIEEEG